ncbi:type 1 periplasmic-binding domain-containing protein [Amycolatopsis thermophila]|uniref:ABC-type branched-subunit amino acid transport system substrate-binding protein n=1 Tax=Amycolatopsis thermophila TaxID=206084 RepID=A0ABU0EUI9_9PSEU|nr:hypothetical protein [Amycolatopsis thermophila]MDQ0378979.1 ABC-type branched-subunit amino acid transport system substrate-binding protein [Amycolatopsis thermophila]
MFEGAHALVDLVRTLYRRPGLSKRDPELRVRGDVPLPLVCLLRRPGSPRFLPRLGAQLDLELRQVPHAYLDADAVRTTAILPLLEELHDRLGADAFGRGHLKRFDHYRLVTWLTERPLPRPEGKGDRPVVRMLRDWSGQRAPGGADAAVDQVPAGGWSKLVLSIAWWIVRYFGFRWGRHRVPGLGRESRWFMRQPFMVPRHSADFLGFAERLTRDRLGSENPEQLKKLLVHAFLQDLRDAYRRRRLRFLPRRRGWRRTAYVTVLLDNVTEANGGWELLRLINEVRNETGDLDPLLIVTASDERPPPPAESGAGIEPADRATRAWASWKRRLPGRRQMLARDARYLFIDLPRATAKARLPEDASVWEDRQSGPPPPPRIARRGVIELAVVVLLAAGLAPVAVSVDRYWGADCSFFRAGLSAGVATKVVDGQCVGYSDNARQVFGDNERLRRAQLSVFAENAKAEELHRASPGRAYVSLVYLAGLTNNENSPATAHAVAEELEGVVIRQREQNDPSSNVKPLLRVIVANGGTGMSAADVVTRDMLVPLLEREPGILGVLGFDRSVAQTESAIAVLGAHGIPALGTTLTAVGLADESPLYFQLVPDNAKQAELLAGYAQYVHAPKVTIYHPRLAPENSYVTTLVDVVQQKLTGVEVRTQGWAATVGELPSLCADGADRSREIVFYAGRETEFGDFLRTVRSNCVEPAKLPRIVADDAVSRFVAHAPDRNRSELNGVPISYVGMGSPVVLGGQACVDGRPGSLPGGGPALDAFCAGYSGLRKDLAQLPPDEAPTTPWAGERVGGLYDAAGFFVDAARRLPLPAGAEAPNRAAVAQQFREMTFQGATGEISFRESRIANERSLAILTITNISRLDGVDGVPTCAYLIGRLYSENSPREGNGCPVSR